MLVVLLLLLLLAPDPLPLNAEKYGPVLVTVQQKSWPDLLAPEVLGGQVEQETCISLKSPGCWNPHTELKTTREYGFGLGQMTVTSAFNTFEEAKRLDPALQDWHWDNRFDPTMQLHAMVLKDIVNYRRIANAATEQDRLAFTFAAYNGGLGGVLSDRRVCSVTRGCDQRQWFGHVEHTSLKARSAFPGYKTSFFDTNRTYVKNILQVRSAKYVVLFQNAAKPQ